MHAIESAVPGWFEHTANADVSARREVERADAAGHASLQLILSLAAIAAAAVLSLW